MDCSPTVRSFTWANPSEIRATESPSSSSGSVIKNQQTFLDYVLGNGIRDVASIWHLEEFIAAQMSVELEIICIFGVADDLIDPNRVMPGGDMLLTNAHELVNVIFIPHVLPYELDQFIRDNIIFHEDFPPDFDDPGFVFTPFFLLEDSRDFPAFSQATEEVLPEYWRVVDTPGSFAPFSRSMETGLMHGRGDFLGCYGSDCCDIEFGHDIIYT